MPTKPPDWWLQPHLHDGSDPPEYIEGFDAGWNEALEACWKAVEEHTAELGAELLGRAIAEHAIAQALGREKP